MSYEPRPEDKFTFGLWTVGNRGREAAQRPSLGVDDVPAPVELMRLCVPRFHLTQKAADHGPADARCYQVSAQEVDQPAPKEPRTTFNVGRIEGGTSINAIPAQATMALCSMAPRSP